MKKGIKGATLTPLAPDLRRHVRQTRRLPPDPEFAGDSATVVDAYIDLKFDPAYSVRLGKVKGPLGLERLQSPACSWRSK